MWVKRDFFKIIMWELVGVTSQVPHPFLLLPNWTPSPISHPALWHAFVVSEDQHSYREPGLHALEHEAWYQFFS